MKKTLLISFLFMLSACKKDKLEGEAAVLVGQWQWEYTVSHYKNLYFGFNSIDTIYATEYANTYQIEFEKKGYIIYKKDNVVERKYRTVFDLLNFDDCSGNLCDFASIRLNNNRDRSIYVTKPSNNLIETSNLNLPFPQPSSEVSGAAVSTTYTHYYKKL